MDTEKPLLAGEAVACAEQPGKVAFDVMGVALSAFDHQRLYGPLGKRAQGFCGHCHMVLDEAGDNLGAFVVDALGGIAIDEQGERIIARNLGDLGLRLLPVSPQPGLVDVLAKADCVAGHVFRIRRHQASGGTAMEIGDYNEQLRTTGDFLRHSAAGSVKGAVIAPLYNFQIILALCRKRPTDCFMPNCPCCGQQLPPEQPEWRKDGEALGRVRGAIARMMREPDPLAGLPGQAKKALLKAGMASAPEAIAKALQEGLVTAKTKGVGDCTMHRIERWLEGKGIVRVSRDEKFFYKKTKKFLP